MRLDHSPTARRTQLGALAVAAVILVGCGNLVDVAPHEAITLPAPEQTSVVVDREGDTLAELHAEQDREIVEFERLPQVLVDAVVAVEDHRYWSHGGIDAPGVLRALGVNVREGRVVQGGSTITQQLAKIALVGADKSVERKITEASVALQLESQFSKEEILAQYLNTVYFGNGAYGAQTAAAAYFGVDVAELDLGQAATLAGLLRAPSRDNPLVNPDRAEDRRNLVLNRMAELDLIAEKDAQQAAEAPLETSPPEPEPWRAPYFVDHVLETIQHDDAFAALGDTPAERAHRLYRGGLRVETTLDPDWQEAAEDAVATTLSHEDDPRAAVVAIEPSTGALRGLVGGRDYDDVDDPVARFNLATKARRQPGSAFKPLTLAAALTQGHSLDETWPAPASLTIPADPPEEPEPWSLANYGDTSFDEIDLREATWYSVNTVYAQLAEAVGGPAIADLAERAGVGRSLPPVRSISLGSVETTPMEIARVNATFAAGGVRHEARTVTRIVDADGEVIWRQPASDGTRVMDEAVAWLTTDALRGVITEGTGELVDLGDHAVAGKTGTTSDYADAWFAGYTPEMALSVWVGFPEGRVSMVPPRTRRRGEGGAWPAEIFHRTANEALAGVRPTDFPTPRGSMVTVEVDASRRCLPNRFTEPWVVEEHTYLAGTQPTEECTEPAGPPLVEVPNVTGLSLADAEEQLDEAGFRATERSRYSTTATPGTVLEQTPTPGSYELDATQREVELWVATDDPEGVDVPDVLGSTADDAVATLQRGGFAVAVETACPDGGDDCDGAHRRPGVVWQQEPAETARAGTTVQLSVYPDASAAAQDDESDDEPIEDAEDDATDQDEPADDDAGPESTDDDAEQDDAEQDDAEQDEGEQDDAAADDAAEGEPAGGDGGDGASEDSDGTPEDSDGTSEGGDGSAPGA